MTDKQMITFNKKLTKIHEQIKQLSEYSFEKKLHPSISNRLTTIELTLKDIIKNDR